MENPFAAWAIEPKLRKLCLVGFNEMREQYDGVNPYHNSDHCLDVAVATYDTGILRNFDTRKLGLGVFAAVYHDMIRGLPENGDDEAASADLAATTLSRSGGISMNECDTVAAMIMGTVTLQNGEGFLQPYAQTLEQRWLASADICSFGMPQLEFRKRANNYYLEINPGKTLQDPEYIEYVRRDIAILQNYAFPLPEIEIPYPHKPDNIRMLQNLYSQLTRDTSE